MIISLKKKKLNTMMDQTKLSLYNSYFHNVYDFVIKNKKIITSYENVMRVLNVLSTKYL